MQGIQFNLIGFFLIAIAMMTCLDRGEQVFQQVVRRPGAALMTIAGVFLLQAMIALSGAQEYRQGARWMVMLNLLFSRLPAALILAVLGLGVLASGAFEVVFPQVFDQMGGSFLETFFLP